MALKNKILVTVDGSNRSLETIRHITRRKPFHKKKLVLFSVLPTIPDFFWDIEREPVSRGAVAAAHAWQVEQKRMINTFMEKAEKILLESGFPEHSIQTHIQKWQKGIARDIVEEAQNGDYCAVVISRSGLGELPEPFLGGTALKVIQKLSFVPVFIAGSQMPGERILIAVDRSEGSGRAVDFVGELMGGFNFKVALVHVIKGSKETPPEFLENEIKSEKENIKPLLDAAKDRLVEFGFQADDVSINIFTSPGNRGMAIVEEAARTSASTIVVGRRGLSRIKEFFMGSVSSSVIQFGRDHAIWVIT